MNERHVEPRPVTSGTSTRPPRPLRRPLVVDLARDSSTLLEEPQWTGGQRNSMTIATTDRLRVTLIALRGGAEIGSAELTDTLVVQVLRGQIRLQADGMDVELESGQLGTVEDPATWKIKADDEDALLLLTTALPDNASHRPAPRA